MLLTTPEQVIVLGGVLVGGWLLGFASAPSPKRWKRRVRAQSDSFTAYHAEAEDRIRAANQRAADLNGELDALRSDHVEAERTIAGLRTAAVAAPVVAADHMPQPAAEPPQVVEDAVIGEPVCEPIEAVAPAPTEAARAAIGPAETELPSTGWFTSSARDDLTRIRGIDGPLDARLFELSVVRFEDLEKFSAEDEMALEQRLALPVGYIAREQWRMQAALLRAGHTDEHAAHFGTTDPAPIA